MLRNVSGANYQLVRGSCAGIIPERVMNVQVNVYSINKQTGISRLDTHRLTQPLKFKDPSATVHHHFMDFTPFSMDMICWNMIFLYWIHHLRLSRHYRVLIKLREDMLNFLKKINQKNPGPHGCTWNFFFTVLIRKVVDKTLPFDCLLFLSSCLGLRPLLSVICGDSKTCTVSTSFSQHPRTVIKIHFNLRKPVPS